MTTMLEQLSHDDKLQTHWAKRLVALFIDVAIIWGPIYIFMALIGWMLGFAWFMGAVVIGFVWFLYSAFLEFAMGATIGKMIMGLKVVPTEGRLELYNAMMGTSSRCSGCSWPCISWGRPPPRSARRAGSSRR